MAEDILSGTVDITPSTEAGPIFKPQVTKQIIAVLEPEPVKEFVPLPRYTLAKRSVILNIETTGLSPLDSRIMCIAVLDPAELEVQALQFMEPSEEETVRAFANVFEAEAWTEVIGFNVDFDYRFIFTAMEKYRIQAPKYMAAKLYDVMKVQQTGQPDFVSTLNKTDTLDAWGKSLVGFGKLYPQEEVLIAWEQGNFRKVMDFNENQVVLTYALWTLDQYVRGNISGEIPGLAEESQVFVQQSPLKSIPVDVKQNLPYAICPECSSLIDKPEGSGAATCPTCGMSVTL